MPEEEPKLPSLPHDFPDPEEFIPGEPWWYYALIAAPVILVLGIIAFFIWKKLKQITPPALPGRDHFKSTRKVLDNIDQTLPIGEVAAECSLALRDLLHQIYREPVLFETDEEIKLRKNSLEKVTEPLRADLIQHLEKLGEEKYAPSQVSESKAQSWIAESHRMVDKLAH